MEHVVTVMMCVASTLPDIISVLWLVIKLTDSHYVYCKCIGGIDCVAWYTAYGRIHYDARVALG